jgi:hypothetical protein
LTAVWPHADLKSLDAAGFEPDQKGLAIRISLRVYLEPKWLRYLYIRFASWLRTLASWPKKKVWTWRDSNPTQKGKQPESVP